MYSPRRVLRRSRTLVRKLKAGRGYNPGPLRFNLRHVVACTFTRGLPAMPSDSQIKPCDPFTPPVPAAPPSRLPEQPGGVGSTSLEDTQTTDFAATGGLLPAPFDDNDDACPFPHTGWLHDRKRVMRALITTGAREERLRRFWQCGSQIWVYEHCPTGELAFRHNHCGDRFCLVCGRLRSSLIAGQIQKLIGKCQPLFMTFTVRGRPGDTLNPLLETLTSAWRQLRASDMWREKIRGGVAMLEVKHSQTSGGHWHPHLHVIADGDYIEVGWLSQLWKTLTAGSSQVHVTRVKDQAHTINYVTKYASKPMDASFLRRPNLLQQAIVALKGRRLCACFGSWYGTRLIEELPDEESPIFTEWRCIGSLRDLEAKRDQGDERSGHILALVERHYRREARFAHRCTGPPAMRDSSAIDADA